MWSWVPSVNLSSEIDQIPLSPETAISGHTLNTGIYIDTLLFILKVKKINNNLICFVVDNLINMCKWNINSKTECFRSSLPRN